MKMKLYDTSFENSIRILLLLNEYDTAQTEGRLCAIDFITVYGGSFGISKEDLNGENPYKFSEFTSRNIKVRNALRELVLNGYVIPVQNGNNILYQITDLGKSYCEALESVYAIEYSETATLVISRFKDKSEKNIVDAINKYAALSVRKENVE